MAQTAGPMTRTRVQLRMEKAQMAMEQRITELEQRIAELEAEAVELETALYYVSQTHSEANRENAATLLARLEAKHPDRERH